MISATEASYATAFLLGIAGAVYVIIRGVERPRRRPGAVYVDDFGRETGLGPLSLRAPTAAACFIAFGLMGYLLDRFTAVPFWVPIAGGGAAAVAAGPLAARLVRRWAQRAATEDAADPRYLLQGHVARVVQAEGAAEPARVEYTANGRRVVAPARSLDHSPLALGTEVVIDRLEDGVVYVESWTRVEQRI